MIKPRRAKLSDIEELQTLLFATWHDTFDGLHGRDFVDEIYENYGTIGELTSRIEMQNAIYVVADDGSKIKGMAFAKGPNEDGIAYLSQLYVHPSMQHQGIGKDLFVKIENSFPEASLLRIGLDVLNTKAIGFYQHLGCTNTGVSLEKLFAGQKIEALVFEKPLG